MCSQTDTQRIFYKLENYLDRLLVYEKYVMPNFVKIVIVVLEISESCVHGHTDRHPRFFYKTEIYLDCFLVPEIYVISNFVKVVRVVLYIYESCVHGQIDR